MKTRSQTWFVVQTSRYHYMTECGDGVGASERVFGIYANAVEALENFKKMT